MIEISFPATPRGIYHWVLPPLAARSHWPCSLAVDKISTVKPVSASGVEILYSRSGKHPMVLPYIRAGKKRGMCPEPIFDSTLKKSGLLERCEGLKSGQIVRGLLCRPSCLPAPEQATKDRPYEASALSLIDCEVEEIFLVRANIGSG